MDSPLHGKTAIVTGGASGMGRAMATRFGSAGCNIVIADIEEPAIDGTVRELEAAGVRVLGVPTDVSDEASMDALGEAVVSHFGDAHILCLNAGVASSGPTAGLRSADWAWVLGVNLWGVIHGLRVFLPGLQTRNVGHVVITASVAGILSYPNMGPYNASKHAVLSIAETLHHELQAEGSAVKVTALCPGLVRTRILESDRNRPEQYLLPALEADDPEREELRGMAREMFENALAPEAVAEMVHDAVIDGTFYVFTDTAYADVIAERHRQIEGAADPSIDGNLLEAHLRDQRAK